jgi:hypothetical protein
MGRSILAVVVAYVVMFALAFLAFACAYLVLGSDVAFKPGLYEASATWIGIAFVINIVDAIIGGFICALIAKGGRAPLALTILVVVLGIVVAIADMNKGKANEGIVRTANTPQLEAVQKAYWPVWVPFAFPFTGAIGVLIGGRLKKGS